MPERGGLDVLRQIRETVGSERLPVILLTSTSDPRAKQKALELGVTDLLSCMAISSADRCFFSFTWSSSARVKGAKAKKIHVIRVTDLNLPGLISVFAFIND
jgi:PleD family two-component response regulator